MSPRLLAGRAPALLLDPIVRVLAAAGVSPTMVTTAPLDTAAKKRTSPFAPTAFFDLAASAANDARTRAKERNLSTGEVDAATDAMSMIDLIFNKGTGIRNACFADQVVCVRWRTRQSTDRRKHIMQTTVK